MRHLSILLLALACAGALAPARARTQGNVPQGPPPAAPQQPGGMIHGTVAGAGSGRPIASAAVSVHASPGGAPVAGALTGADGSFRIAGLRPGSYTVRVAALGFGTVTRTGVSVGAAGQQVALGRISLAVSAVQIEGLSVLGERRDVRLAPDRNSYAVRDMPAAAGGTAVDVLRNVPAVEVDGGNNVSLRGNQNVVVQINGRPTAMRGEQLGSFLAQLPASMVERVEVIPNPSAKQDPEGMAGIINLALKQSPDLGTSGGLTVGGGSTGQINASGNLGYQKGPLTLFGSYGFMRDRREITGFSNREILGESTLSYTFLHQEQGGTMSPLSHSFNGSAEHRLGRHHALSANLVVSGRRGRRSMDNLNREMDAARGPLALARMTNEETTDGLAFDWALQYRHAPQPRRNVWSTEVRYNRSSDSATTRLTDQPLTLQAQPADATPSLHSNDTGSHTGRWTLQADLVRMLGERTRLEAGYKGSLRRVDNDLTVADYSYALGEYVPDLARSNAFDYRERVNAVYGLLSRTIGSFDLQGGLRLEHASSDLDLRTTGESYSSDYSSVFPSALAAYNLDDSRQLKLSYSKRIERPSPRQLNPFPFYWDPLTVTRGNPRLRPVYTHALEAGWQQSFEHGSLQVTPFYRHTVGAVRSIHSLGEDGAAVTTYENVATSSSHGADVTGSLRVGKLNGFGGISVFEQVTDGSNLATDVSNSAFGWSARVSASWKISPGLDAQGFVMYRAPMSTEQGRTSSMTFLNLSLRRKLFGEKASLSLRVTDPFNTERIGWVTRDPAFHLETERQFGGRGIFLSFSYNFGRAPQTRQPRPDQPQDNPGIPQ